MGPKFIPCPIADSRENKFGITGMKFEYLMDSNAKTACYICKSRI